MFNLVQMLGKTRIALSVVTTCVDFLLCQLVEMLGLAALNLVLASAASIAPAAQTVWAYTDWIVSICCTVGFVLYLQSGFRKQLCLAIKPISVFLGRKILGLDVTNLVGFLCVKYSLMVSACMLSIVGLVVLHDRLFPWMCRMWTETLLSHFIIDVYKYGSVVKTAAQLDRLVTYFGLDQSTRIIAEPANKKQHNLQQHQPNPPDEPDKPNQPDEPNQPNPPNQPSQPNQPNQTNQNNQNNRTDQPNQINPTDQPNHNHSQLHVYVGDSRNQQSQPNYFAQKLPKTTNTTKTTQLAPDQKRICKSVVIDDCFVAPVYQVGQTGVNIGAKQQKLL